MEKAKVWIAVFIEFLIFLRDILSNWNKPKGSSA